jgi:DNA-binding MarR family transcriptional regulator
MHACGLENQSSVAYHLRKLIACGYIAREPGSERSIRVLVPLVPQAERRDAP